MSLKGFSGFLSAGLFQKKFMVGRLIYILLLLVALGACLFLGWAYSHLLDFFPWGSNSAYVIWEPLVLYFILPAFFTVGIITVLTSGKNAPRSNFLFLAVGVLLALPVLLGFDLETDQAGRWAGVLTAMVSALLVLFVMREQILKIVRKQP